MKRNFRSVCSPVLGGALLLALPVAALVTGCSGGSGGLNPGSPSATATPVVTTAPPVAGTNLVFSDVSADYSGSSTSITGGTSTFTRRKEATADGLDADIVVAGNPTRKLFISISTAGQLQVGKSYASGVSDDFSSSTSVDYREDIPGPDYSLRWGAPGGPDTNNGSITVVALTNTTATLRVNNVRLNRVSGIGPPSNGSFVLNGTLVIPND